MSAEQFRPIFERFRTLNLLILREAASRGQVASGTWFNPASKAICPLVHGCARTRQWGTWKSLMEALGSPPAALSRFAGWWDESIQDPSRKQALIALLDSIIRERMEDADAVQSVIAAPITSNLLRRENHVPVEETPGTGPARSRARTGHDQRRL